MRAEVLFLLLPGQVQAQPKAVAFPYPELPSQVAMDSAAAPEGWHVMQVAWGDLDHDGRPDFALALQFHDAVPHLRPDSGRSDAPPRILAVYRRTPDDRYDRVVQSNSFLLRDDEGGMTPPELELRFEADTLHVRSQFLRGAMDHGFVLGTEGLVCTSFENAGVVGDMVDELRMDLVHDVAVHRQGPMDTDLLSTEERITVPPHPPLTIERLAMPMHTTLGPGLHL